MARESAYAQGATKPAQAADATISDERLHEMSGRECKEELNRRGYYKPPYIFRGATPYQNSCRNIRQENPYVLIMAEASNPPMMVVGDDCAGSSQSAFDMIMAVVKGGVTDEERLRNIEADFIDGLPKVSKMSDDQARNMLKLIGAGSLLNDGVAQAHLADYEAAETAACRENCKEDCKRAACLEEEGCMAAWPCLCARLGFQKLSPLCEWMGETFGLVVTCAVTIGTGAWCAPPTHPAPLSLQPRPTRVCGVVG